MHELVEGRGGEITVSAVQVQTLLDYVAAMREAASPSVREAIDREMPRLDVPSWTGLTMEDWVQQIDRLSCEPSDTALCLNGGRFRVEVEWETAQGDEGHGQAVQLTPDTGYFWFFRAGNVEQVVKVLDGCSLGNPRFWVFATGLTNVRVVTTVTDTLRDETRTYVNDQGQAFSPIQDTAAFNTCP